MDCTHTLCCPVDDFTFLSEGPGSMASCMASYDTIPDLRTKTDLSSPCIVAVLGSTSAYDGFGGLYSYEEDITTTDDGVVIIKPNSISGALPGRWKKFV